MSGDRQNQERARLLTRWRDAAPGRGQEVVHVLPLPARELPRAPPAGDEATLFREFETEIRRAVATPLAEKLCGLMAEPWANYQRESTPKNRAKVFAALDLVEDALDALVLLGSKPVDEREAAP